MKPEGFPRRLRLRRRREFLRVQRSGAKYHTRFFLVFVAPSALRPQGRPPVASRDTGGGDTDHSAGSAAAEQLPETRLGVTVTRKVGKAVKRNRIKRLVREAFRRERHPLPAGLDLVFVAKRDATEATFEDVIQDLRTLTGRLQHATRPSPSRSASSRSAASRSGPSVGHPSRSR